MLEQKEKEQVHENEKVVTRRKFLLTAGALATGLIATGITGCSTSEPAKTAATGKTDAAETKTNTNGPAPALPWKYKKIDVDKVRKRGYENYFKYGCMYAAASALLTTLAEDNGTPWDTIPLDMFQYGAAGAYGWGTLCGALNGSLAVINLASAKHAEIGNELIGWYTKFPFPSNKHEAYCHFKNQVTTVSDSPLCHVSVSKWAAAAGARINEKAKKDRCAKLSGDTAARAAELLNEALEKGAIVATYKVPDEFSHCMSCHQSEKSLLDNEQGKMDCLYCHGDHTKTGKKQ
ncbi:C-GCAxxG-C-C family (seleno)protein [Thermincola potens]|uniref:Split soret cytochrome c n=1 Tax=Thermincola potens (strain JR) TaxID=635013 RepID=D5XB70_THEPJ|nr:C-GCAxxG-C-C family (seleno)protein [Thermincola potens]ADG81390.1 split soret cytochrome c precursor [Thermincola potens JR]